VADLKRSAKQSMPSKRAPFRKKKSKDVSVPTLGKDVAFLLCGLAEHSGHQGLEDGDYSIQLFGNSRGFKKLGRYFLALGKLDTSDDRGFHHHFFRVRSLSKTKIGLTVRKNRTADISGMIR
jgi:hypothetical protein